MKSGTCVSELNKVCLSIKLKHIYIIYMHILIRLINNQSQTKLEFCYLPFTFYIHTIYLSFITK